MKSYLRHGILPHGRLPINNPKINPITPKMINADIAELMA
jgi:hypothetical protein